MSWPATCAPLACPAGQAVCFDGCGPIDWEDGCADPMGQGAPPAFSGGCGNAAGNRPSSCMLPHASSACAGFAQCAVRACAPGYADCDGQPANGCEADLLAPSTCGACNVACSPGQVCTPGGCAASCAPPTTLCTTVCADLATDPKNCGTCGKACPADPNVGQIATCAAGQCGMNVTCAAGSTPCGASCLDLAVDPANCGACGHACTAPVHGRAVCNGGACGTSCQPGWTLAGGACIPPSIETAQWLATGLPAPEDVAVDTGYVYWSDPTEGTIRRVPKTGGTSSVIAPSLAKPLRLALDATYVYWTENLGGAVRRAPKDGSAAPTLVANAIQPWGIAVIGARVYWVNNGPDAKGNYLIASAPVAGGQPVTVATFYSGTPDELQTDGTSLFSQVPLPVPSYGRVDPQSGAVTGFPLGGFDPFVVYPGGQAWMAIGPNEVYVSQGSAQGGSAWQGIVQVDRVTLSMRALVASIPLPSTTRQGVGDGCALYYAADGAIQALVHGWTYPAPLVAANAKRLAVDGSYVYWSDQSGAIARVPAP